MGFGNHFSAVTGNEFFCEIDYQFLETQLEDVDVNKRSYLKQVRNFYDACEEILQFDCDCEKHCSGKCFHRQRKWLCENHVCSRGTQEALEYNYTKEAGVLYGLLHSRYIMTHEGMEKMKQKYENGDFGYCPRVYCENQHLLPVGLSDIHKKATVKMYCPKCEDLYHPRSSRFYKVDGAFFGTGFPHMFLMTHPELRPKPSTFAYVPTLFGFQLHPEAIKLQKNKADIQNKAAQAEKEMENKDKKEQLNKENEQRVPVEHDRETSVQDNGTGSLVKESEREKTVEEKAEKEEKENFDVKGKNANDKGYRQEPRKENKAKLLERSGNINPSEITISDVVNHFCFNYQSYKMDKKITEPHKLFGACMEFCFPNGIPKTYLHEYLEIYDDTMSKSEVLYRKFMKRPENSWLNTEFNTDYCKASDDEIFKQGENLWLAFTKLRTGIMPPSVPNGMKSAYNLAKRMHKLLVFLRNDREKTSSIEKNQCEEGSAKDIDKKHDRIKGVLYQMLSYLGIETVYNGEGELDFQYNLYSHEERSCTFKVKPDAIGHTTFGPGGLREMSSINETFLVFEVFGTDSSVIMEKPSASLETSEKMKNNVMSSSNPEDTELSSLNEETRADTCNISTSNTEHKLSHKMKYSKTNKFQDSNSNENIRPTCKVFNSDIEKEFSTSEAFSTESNDTNKHGEIISCGPIACSTNTPANKLYVQLALQLYSALIQRRILINSLPSKQSIRWTYRRIDDSGDQNEVIFGFFLMNEYVYLARLSGSLNELEHDDVTLTYAKNLWFNLNIPGDRMALLCFFFHLEQIHVEQANNLWD